MIKWKIDDYFDPDVDKELLIVPTLHNKRVDYPAIILDYDDVDHDMVDGFAKKLIEVLNDNFNERMF